MTNWIGRGDLGLLIDTTMDEELSCPVSFPAAVFSEGNRQHVLR